VCLGKVLSCGDAVLSLMGLNKGCCDFECLIGFGLRVRFEWLKGVVSTFGTCRGCLINKLNLKGIICKFQSSLPTNFTGFSTLNAGFKTYGGAKPLCILLSSSRAAKWRLKYLTTQPCLRKFCPK